MHNSFILLIIYWRFYNYFNKIYRDIIILLYSLYRQMINLEIQVLRGFQAPRWSTNGYVTQTLFHMHAYKKYMLNAKVRGVRIMQYACMALNATRCTGSSRHLPHLNLNIQPGVIARSVRISQRHPKFENVTPIFFKLFTLSRKMYLGEKTI